MKKVPTDKITLCPRLLDPGRSGSLSAFLYNGAQDPTKMWKRLSNFCREGIKWDSSVAAVGNRLSFRGGCLSCDCWQGSAQRRFTIYIL